VRFLEVGMKYFRKTSRIAWLLGLTALLVACSSVQAREAERPDHANRAYASQSTIPDWLGGNSWWPQTSRMAPIPAPRSADTFSVDEVDAKVSAWLGPLDDRRFVYWSPSQTNLRRERSARQEEPLDKRRRDARSH